MKDYLLYQNNMKNIYTKIIIGLLAISPSIALADGKDLKYLARLVTEYLNIGLSLIIGLAVLTFVWNIYRYFFTEKERTEAGYYVMYSIIGFFLILSFWGLVAIVRNSLKLDDQAPVFRFGTFNGGSAGTQTPTNFNTNTNTSSGATTPNTSPRVGNDPDTSPVKGNDAFTSPIKGNDPDTSPVVPGPNQNTFNQGF